MATTAESSVPVAKRLATDVFTIGNPDLPIVYMSESFLALIKGQRLDGEPRRTKISVIPDSMSDFDLLFRLGGDDHVVVGLVEMEKALAHPQVRDGVSLYFFATCAKGLAKITAICGVGRANTIGWHLYASLAGGPADTARHVEAGERVVQPKV